MPYGLSPYVMIVERRRRRSYKVRQSQISRTVWPRIAQFYGNLQTYRAYNNAGYDITMYFRPEVIDVRKTTENDVI